MASAAIFRLGLDLGAGISQSQKRFLPQRSMFVNIVDIDQQAQVVSLKHSRWGGILFDFAAVSLGFDHKYIHRTLEHITFYSDTRCHIAVLSQRHTDFQLIVGVRQGSPLSPLLFATMVDVLLRCLTRRLPDCLTRAFADGIAMTTPNFDRALPTSPERF